MTPPLSAEIEKIVFGVTSSQSLRLLGRIPKMMADQGWEVHVVSGDTETEAPTTLSGVKLHTLPMVRNPSPLQDFSSFVRWMILLRRVKPTIIVVGTPKAALLGLIASMFCRVPVRIYQLRGLRLQTVSGLARHLLYVVEWFTSKSATAILAVSHSLRDEYCRLGLSHRNKTQVFGLGSSHGVDIHYFHPTRWSTWEPPEPKLRQARSEQVPILGFVGRFSEDKGALELLECCKILVDYGIKHAFLIIGPVEEAEDTLNGLRMLSEHSVITGSVQDVAPYYSLMDLLVLPSHREGFPNAVLEAAASGVPTVTTNATGAIDSVIDGETGLIVPTHDGHALATAVMKLINDPKLREEMGSKARDWVVNNFDSALVTKNHSLYISQKVLRKTFLD